MDRADDVHGEEWRRRRLRSHESRGPNRSRRGLAPVEGVAAADGEKGEQYDDVRERTPT
jgi:hypothetical protein